MDTIGNKTVASNHSMYTCLLRATEGRGLLYSENSFRLSLNLSPAAFAHQIGPENAALVRKLGLRHPYLLHARPILFEELEAFSTLEEILIIAFLREKNVDFKLESNDGILLHLAKESLKSSHSHSALELSY
jgi:hypothetical protein